MIVSSLYASPLVSGCGISVFHTEHLSDFRRRTAGSFGIRIPWSFFTTSLWTFSSHRCMFTLHNAFLQHTCKEEYRRNKGKDCALKQSQLENNCCFVYGFIVNFRTSVKRTIALYLWLWFFSCIYQLNTLKYCCAVLFMHYLAVTWHFNTLLLIICSHTFSSEFVSLIKTSLPSTRFLFPVLLSPDI